MSDRIPIFGTLPQGNYPYLRPTATRPETVCRQVPGDSEECRGLGVGAGARAVATV